MLVSVPPPLPRTRKSEPGELDEYLTLWVGTGTAHLRIEDGREYRVDAGSGICVPPGTEHDVWTEPGTLTLPVWSAAHPLGGDAQQVAPLPITERHRTRLIERYSRWAWDDVPAFTAAEPVPPDLGIRSGPVGSASDHPPLPHSGPALRVALELRRRPASDRGLEEWAAWAGCSPSTLRRAFLGQTGCSFAQWRQRARLAAAAEHLTAGWSVGRAAVEVGFASRWGFSGAFRTHYGMTPRDFTAQAAEGADGREEPPAAADPGGPGAAGEPLQHNVMLWVRSGELRARFAERLWTGRVGDVVWLPAGTSVEAAPGSSTPLSILCTDCVQLDRPRRASFSPAWHDWLLWASVSTNSLLKPAEHHGRVPRRERAFHTHVIDAFTAREAVERARSVPMPSDERARAVAAGLLRTLGTTAGSGTREVPAESHEVFRRETGMSVASWRQAARMRLARQLLQSGMATSGVAARVGTRWCRTSAAPSAASTASAPANTSNWRVRTRSCGWADPAQAPSIRPAGVHRCSGGRRPV